MVNMYLARANVVNLLCSLLEPLDVGVFNSHFSKECSTNVERVITYNKWHMALRCEQHNMRIQKVWGGYPGNSSEVTGRQVVSSMVVIHQTIEPDFLQGYTYMYVPSFGGQKVSGC